MNYPLAIVTGILGQDGHYLKKILLDNGFNIIGVDLPKEIKNTEDRVNIIFDDVADLNVVQELISKHKPYVVFNLAGYSNVFDPWGDQEAVIKSTTRIPENFITSIRTYSPKTKFCQASSCLVFGNTTTDIQTENTPRSPSYLYGVCKNYVDNLIKEYRKELGLSFSSAIFYNHESPYRGDSFFTKKIINFAKNFNPNEKLYLKNLNVKKDIGFAGDYMDAMFRIATANESDDYIVSTGKLVSLKDIINKVCVLSGFDLWKCIIVDETQGNNKILCGDNTKIKNKLNWIPSHDWEQTIELIWNKK
jgi:GDPmannose 4,6-dehydratase